MAGLILLLCLTGLPPSASILLFVLQNKVKVRLSDAISIGPSTARDLHPIFSLLVQVAAPTCPPWMLQVPAPDGSGAVDDHGVHAFVVPLRDANRDLLPGVEIRDCGYKVDIAEHDSSLPNHSHCDEDSVPHLLMTSVL